LVIIKTHNNQQPFDIPNQHSSYCNPFNCSVATDYAFLGAKPLVHHINKNFHKVSYKVILPQPELGHINQEHHTNTRHDE
jgi:hypothetical protein